MRLSPFLALLLSPVMAGAQPTCRTAVHPFDGAGEVRRRAEELTTGVRAGFGVLRSPLACAADTTRKGAIVTVVAPHLRVDVAGGLPDSRGDGALWAGRGLSALTGFGVTFDWDVLHVALLPEVWSTQNRPFDVLPGADSSRSAWASPFNTGRFTLDLPSRMGRLPITELTPGQSAVWVRTGPAEFGWSASNLWWGTGVRDALFVGPTAAGIPRLFLRTARPLETRLGRLSADYFLGVLTESRFFDHNLNNDRRSLSAVAVTWSPRRSDAVVLGIARGVAKVVPTDSSLVRHVADAFAPLGIADGDQLTALFARYALPRSGLRAYAEIARSRTTSDLRDILTVPSEGLAYQVGVEQLIRRTSANWMLLFEAMNLEQGVDVKERPPRDFYAGDGTPHGWTQRGQLLGAGIGPGGQSQFISADRIAKRWSVGLFAERVRWNNDALYRQYLAYANRHDVSLRFGARLGARRWGYDMALDASYGKRLNYLFQNSEFLPNYRTVDVSVPQLHLTFTPVVR